MKRLVLAIACVFSALALSAQPAGSRLPLKVYLEDMPQPFPVTAKVQMVSKLNQVLTRGGISSVDIYNDFVLTAVANPLEKVVVSGAPVQIMQEVDFSFYIVDAVRKIVFSSYSVTAKGVGQSDAKCCMDAMKRVNLNTPHMMAFVMEGKKKILAYYDAEAQNIFAKARQLKKAHQYEEALYLLCGFPSECKSYAQSIEVGNEIYQDYIDYKAQQNLALARSAWVAEQNSAGAASAGVYLAEIYPEASCYPEAMKLYEEMKAKVREDWEWEMKKYQDGVDLEKQRISAWQAVGVAFGQNQKPTTTNLAWLR